MTSPLTDSLPRLGPTNHRKQSHRQQGDDTDALMIEPGWLSRLLSDCHHKGGMPLQEQPMMSSDRQPPKKPERPQACEMCGRAVPLTFHHLVPRGVHRRGRFVRRYGKEEMRTVGLWVCRLCHSGIHKILPNEKELAESYYTKELLLGHEGIARHVAWVRKQKNRGR